MSNRYVRNRVKRGQRALKLQLAVVRALMHRLPRTDLHVGVQQDPPLLTVRSDGSSDDLPAVTITTWWFYPRWKYHRPVDVIANEIVDSVVSGVSEYERFSDRAVDC